MMPNTKPKLIAILGAESTGKTNLAQALAGQLNCPWVAEYLRDFCAEKNRTPQPQEQRGIMTAQMDREKQALSIATTNQAPFVFCDTTPLQTAVYSDYIFSDDSLYAEAKAWHSRYALTLVLALDIDWVADGLQRDGAHVRETIHAMIVRALGETNAIVSLIHGYGEMRYQHAVNALKACDMNRRIDAI